MEDPAEPLTPSARWRYKGTSAQPDMASAGALILKFQLQD